MSRPDELIGYLQRKYVWWRPHGDEPAPEARVLAQAMHLGTYDDIRLLERSLGPERLVDIMAAAQPGWFDGRSWSFWLGRLRGATAKALPDAPPRRSFRGA